MIFLVKKVISLNQWFNLERTSFVDFEHKSIFFEIKYGQISSINFRDNRDKSFYRFRPPKNRLAFDGFNSPLRKSWRDDPVCSSHHLPCFFSFSAPQVSRRFNEICASMLNSTFYKFSNLFQQRYEVFVSQHPKTSSLRKWV